MKYRVDRFLDDTFYITAGYYEEDAYLGDSFLAPAATAFNLTMAVAEKKQSVSAHLQQKFTLTASLVQKKQSFSGQLQQKFNLSAAVAQKKEAFAAQLQDKFNLTAALIQKKERVSGGLQLSYTLQALLAQKKEAFAANMNEGEMDLTIALAQKKQNFTAQLEIIPAIVPSIPELILIGGQWYSYADLLGRTKKKTPEPAQSRKIEEAPQPVREPEAARAMLRAFARNEIRPRKLMTPMDLRPVKRVMTNQMRKTRERREREVVEIG